MKTFISEVAAPATALAFLLLPVLAAGLPLRSGPVPLGLARSPLPVADATLLRKVQKEVKALKVPRSSKLRPSSHSQPVASSMVAGTPCPFMGGLISADVSERCCTNVRVISQRRLVHYGLEHGQIPKPATEAHSVEDLCDEPGCLQSVVQAMRSNWMTTKGAAEMGDICTPLAVHTSRNSSAGAISGFLHGVLRGQNGDEKDEKDGGKDKKQKDAKKKSDGKGEEEDKAENGMAKGDTSQKIKDADARAEKLQCEEEVCSDHARREKLCDELHDQKDKCYKWCCESHSVLSGCFAGEATVNVEDRGPVPLAALRVGDMVLAERSGQLTYEPILTFLHSVRPAFGKRAPFLLVVHNHGEFRATDTHLVFVATDDVAQHGVSKLVGKLLVGDRLLVRDPSNSMRMISSRISAIRRTSGEMGLYAPLTASGTILVDGVLASNYAAPSLEKELAHQTAHAFLLPLRIYHHIGLGIALRPYWKSICRGSRSWLCHGDHLDSQYKSELHGKIDELHPYLVLMYRVFRVDKFLK